MSTANGKGGKWRMRVSAKVWVWGLVAGVLLVAGGVLCVPVPYDLGTGMGTGMGIRTGACRQDPVMMSLLSEVNDTVRPLGYHSQMELLACVVCSYGGHELVVNVGGIQDRYQSLKGEKLFVAELNGENSWNSVETYRRTGDIVTVVKWNPLRLGGREAAKELETLLHERLLERGGVIYRPRGLELLQKLVFRVREACR